MATNDQLEAQLQVLGLDPKNPIRPIVGKDVKSKHLTNGKLYHVAWISPGGFVAVRTIVQH